MGSITEPDVLAQSQWHQGLAESDTDKMASPVPTFLFGGGLQPRREDPGLRERGQDNRCPPNHFGTDQDGLRQITSKPQSGRVDSVRWCRYPVRAHVSKPSARPWRSELTSDEQTTTRYARLFRPLRAKPKSISSTGPWTSDATWGPQRGDLHRPQLPDHPHAAGPPNGDLQTRAPCHWIRSLSVRCLARWRQDWTARHHRNWPHSHRPTASS